MILSRRHVLRGGVGLAAGCLLVSCGGKGGPSTPSPSASGSKTPPPLSAAGRNAITNEHTLLGAYEAVLARHPNLAGALTVPQSHHRAHLIALGDQPTSSSSSIAVPTDPQAAVLTLMGLEQAASTQWHNAAVDDFGYGSLLAAIAAAEAIHVDLLNFARPGLKASS